MAKMSLDTAIRLSAEVKGGGNIDRVKREIQSLAASSKLSARDLGTMRVAALQLAKANNGTVAGIRSSIAALRGLQEQAKIGGQEFRALGADIQRLEAKLKGLDGTAKVAGRSLGQQLATGLAAAGIGQALRGITVQAGKFDAELRKAAAIEGSAGSFEVLRKEIEAVASTAAGTPTEVAALATALSRAGFSADQTAKALRGIVQGAEATDTAFADMGGIVGTILKTFQVDASQTSGIVDVLVKSANSANQTVIDVGEAMSYAAGQAATLGVDIKDTSALIALLADAGARGSRGGTAIATGLSRLQIAAGGADSEMQELIKGSAKMAEAMTRLGASILDAEGDLKPMDEVLVAIKRQMDGMSATDKAIIAKALFGADSGKAFQALLARSEQDIVSMFSKMRDAGGVAAETQQKMQGFDYSIKVLGGNVENVTNQIGGMIGAGLKPLIDGLNAAIGASQNLPEPIKAIGAAAAAAGVAALGLAVAMNAIKSALAIVGGIQAVTAALVGKTAATWLAVAATKALSVAIAAAPWLTLAAGIAAATYALANYQTQSQKMGAAARTGDPKAMAGARTRLSNVGQDISLLERQRERTSGGRERRDIDAKLAKLRTEQSQLRGDVQAGDRATVPAAAQLPPAAQLPSSGMTGAAGGGGSSRRGSGGGSASKAARDAKRAAEAAARDAKRAAEAAAREESRVKDILRNRSADIDLMGIKFNLEERIADAQSAGDKLLERRLEGQQRQVDIQTEYARLLADPANKDARIQEILVTQGLLALKAEEVRTERELQAIERERAEEQRKSTPSFILGEAYDKSVSKLKDLTNAGNILAASADSIGSAFGSAFRDLITGATSASEALGRMFQSIADSFADMAAQIIAEWIRMQILGIVKSIFGSVAGGFSFGGSSGGFNLPGFEMPSYMAGTAIPSGFANGAAFDRGIVDSPTLFKFANGGAMRTGVMGEAGPEAILPLKRGANGQLGVQMVGPARQFAANRAALDGSTTGSGTSSPLAESRQALATAETSIRNRQADRSIEQAFSAPGQALKIQYDSQVINNVEYVTSDQFQRGMSQAAERGRALTLGALKNSVKARRQVGI